MRQLDQELPGRVTTDRANDPGAQANAQGLGFQRVIYRWTQFVCTFPHDRVVLVGKTQASPED